MQILTDIHSSLHMIWYGTKGESWSKIYITAKFCKHVIKITLYDVNTSNKFQKQSYHPLQSWVLNWFNFRDHCDSWLGICDLILWSDLNVQAIPKSIQWAFFNGCKSLKLIMFFRLRLESWDITTSFSA